MLFGRLSSGIRAFRIWQSAALLLIISRPSPKPGRAVWRSVPVCALQENLRPSSKRFFKISASERFARHWSLSSTRFDAACRMGDRFFNRPAAGKARPTPPPPVVGEGHETVALPIIGGIQQDN